MRYKEFGDRTKPPVIFLHGGGLSWWSFTDIIHLLKTKYFIVTPIIDGHGEDGATEFVSIQGSAQKLIQYIDANFNGNVLAVCGFSLGGQIAVEVLSKRADIAKYAIIESTSVIPLNGLARSVARSGELVYGLIGKRWFARMQARALFVKEKLFDQYYKDRKSMHQKSLVNITQSNAGYAAPDTLKNTGAKMLIIIGTEEIRRLDQSVRKLMRMLPQAQVCVVPGMKRGEFSLAHCTEYLALLNRFMA